MSLRRINIPILKGTSRQGVRMLGNPFVGGFDPATLALTGWWRDYAASAPWAGTASAGTSGSHTLVAGVEAIPTAGTPLSGHGTARFTAASFNSLTDSAVMTSLVSNASGSLVALYSAATAAADAGDGFPYLIPAFLSDDDGNFGFGYSTSGVRGGYWNGSNYDSRAVAAAVGSYHAGQMKWDSSNLSVRVDSGLWTTIPRTAASLTASVCRCGTNFSGGVHLDGTLAERMISDIAFSDATFDNIVSYFNSRYGLML